MINERFKAYYRNIARETAKLSYAQRLKVGAIIVKDNRIISIGYNGMPSGWDNSCEQYDPESIPDWVTHDEDRVIYGKLRSRPEVLHAEANAITKLAKSTESGDKSTLFVTHTPCLECAKLIYQSGIDTVYYDEDYVASKGCGLDFLRKCGITVERIDNE
jgi:dCMP deaminase